MRLLDRAVLREGNQAPSLPNTYESFLGKQIAFRRGEVSMIAGQPGAGKSTLALALAVRARVSTLYFSADTHAHTMSLRLISMLTGVTQDQAEPMMMRDKQWASEILGDASHIRWSFESAPSMRDIETELEAHIELTGESPELVVVDNLVDCVGGDGDEWGSLRNMMKDFKWLAREHECSFVVLHHTSEGVQGNPCPPRFSLQGKVAQTPALILTVANDNAGFLGVCPVKNRYGPSYPGGNDPVWLSYDPASMAIADMERM